MNPHDVTPDGKTFVGVGVNPLGQTEGWIATIRSFRRAPTCGGHAATVFVDADGHIVGGPQDGNRYRGVLFGTYGGRRDRRD